MSFPPDFLDTLRSRVSLSEIVGRRVSWDARKTNLRRRDFWACCPFHGEKSPSFHVDEAKGFFHCFGCGVSGDAIGFLQQLDGLSFPEAVERLAAEAGLQMPPKSPRDEAAHQRRKSLHDVLDLAARFFASELKSARGANARSYLDGRGCGPALWDTFGLGVTTGRTSLLQHLRAQDVSVELMLEAGLVLKRDETGEVIDRFRERLMFPIADERGRVVGFGGRILVADDKAPKYLNSPETPLFHKGRLLFNYARAREAKAETLIVCEGYMDVIAFHGAGFPNAVAPLGTALTAEQLELLWRMAAEPILCFDGDAAGQRAAAKAADLALPLVRAGRSVRFALLPEGLDPDDLVRAQGPEALKACLATPQSLIDLIWERERALAPIDTPERRADLERRLRALIKGIADPAVRTHYAQELRARVDALFAAPPPAQGGPPRARMAGPLPGATPSLKRTALARSSAGGAMDPFLADAEAELLVMLLDHPALLDRMGERLSDLEFHAPPLDKICNELIHLASCGAGLDTVSVRDHLQSCGILGLADALAMREIVRRRRRAWSDLPDHEAEEVWRAAFERRVRMPVLQSEIDQKAAQVAADPLNSELRRQYEALRGEWQALFAPNQSAPGTLMGL